MERVVRVARVVGGATLLLTVDDADADDNDEKLVLAAGLGRGASWKLAFGTWLGR